MLTPSRLLFAVIRTLLSQCASVYVSLPRTRCIIVSPNPLHITNVCSRDRARLVNASAAKLDYTVGSISASRITCLLYEVLTSEAQEIPTPISQPYPIVYGFSLPPRYFPRSPSTDIVVKMFCQMVSCVCDHQAWDEYVTASIPSDNMQVVHYSQNFTFPANLDTQRLRELERSWTKNEKSDRALVSSLGPSMCANLVKVRPLHTIYSKPTLF